MQEGYRLIQTPYHFQPTVRHVENRVFPLVHPDGSITTVITVGDLLNEASSQMWERFQYGGELVLTVNGHRVTDPNRIVRDGDFIVISGYVGGGAGRIIAMIGVMIIAAVVAYFAPYALPAYLAAYGSLASALAGAAVMMVGGILINTFMPLPMPKSAAGLDSGQDSPTYGWAIKQNPSRVGMAIPVIYGRTASYPQVINRFIATSGNGQWLYSLLCMGEGYTNNLVTEADIFINSEPITTVSNRYVQARDGSMGQPCLTSYPHIHQWRDVGKETIDSLTWINGDLLLFHFNNNLTDDSGHGMTWTLAGGAGYTATTPLFGSHSLHCPLLADYITSADDESFDITNNFTLEFFFRRTSNAHYHAICGQLWMVEYIEYEYLTYEWSVIYDSVLDTMTFYLYRKDINYNDPDGSPMERWELHCQCNGTYPLAVDTWSGHICFQKTGSAIRLYFDGVYQGEQTLNAQYLTTPTYMYQFICRAYLTGDIYGGYCDVDEFRFSDGILYDWAGGFTPPAPPTELVQSTPSEDDVLIGVFTTKRAVDRIILHWEAPYGIYWTNSEGQLDTYSVQMEVSYRTVGDPNWIYSDFAITGASRYGLRGQHTIDMVTCSYQELKIRRTTPKSSDTRISDRVFWTGFDEVLLESQTYPGLQVVGVDLFADEKFSGGAPTIKVITNRTEIYVPNYNDVGTHVVSSQNNAWAAYDMMTNQYSGRGISPTRIDSTAWDAWAAYCIEVVDSVARCRCDIIMDETSNLYDALSHICQGGRANIIPSGSNYTVIIDKPGLPVYLFSAGNMIKDTFRLDWIDQTKKTDAIEIVFLDEDKEWEQNSVMAKASWFETMERPPNVVSLTLRSVTRKHQAIREAILRIQKTEFTTRVVQFSVDVEAAVVQVGDVIYVIHNSTMNCYDGRARLDVSASALVTMDQVVNLSTALFDGKGYFYCRNLDGTIIDEEIVGPWDTDTEIIELANPVTLSRFDPFGIARPNTDKMLYRVTSMRLNQDQTVEITAAEYNSAAYYHADYDGGLVAI